MNYTDLATTYGPAFLNTALHTANTFRDYIMPADKNINRTNETWVDPICAMIALAILKKEPEGTKLSFKDMAIIFNAPGPLQPYIRRHEKSSRNDLYNLTSAIYYSIKWLNLAVNSKYEIIFTMARDGILRMRDTYRQDLMTQQYLTTTHLKMLNDALEKKTISQEEFMIPNHDENPLNKQWLFYLV